jgi:putative Mg2+ transporter-C (MgtC) family protein
MISEVQIILRLLAAAGLGAIIGLERERDNQPAGLRTHMILVIGSALAMILSINIAVQFDGDPARLAAQVISGIGFLGAGAILRYGFNVKGLTTATTLWSMAIVGLAVGYGYYLIGLVTTIPMLLTLTVINLLEKKFIRTSIARTFIVQAVDRPGIVKDIRKVITRLSEKIITFTIQKNIKNKRLRISIAAHVKVGEKMENLTEAISAIDGVRALKIE